MTYTGPSIVDYLNSLGQNSSYSARASLAASKGIQGYTGTAAQNTQLLNLLRSTTQTYNQPGTSPNQPQNIPNLPQNPPSPQNTQNTPNTPIYYSPSPQNFNPAPPGTPTNAKETNQYTIQDILNKGYTLQQAFTLIGGADYISHYGSLEAAAQAFHFPPPVINPVTINLNTGQKLNPGESFIYKGKTYVQGQNIPPGGDMSATRPFTPQIYNNTSGPQGTPAPYGTPMNYSQLVQFDPNTGKPLQPGQSVTFQGQTYTQGQPLPTGGTGATGGNITPGAPGATGVPGTPLGQQLNINTNLTPGTSGPQVKALQEFLISQGFSIPDGATGYYGPQTKAAVAAWQHSVGIQAPANEYGYFGPKSRAYLSSLNNPQPPGSPTGSPTDQGTVADQQTESTLKSNGIYTNLQDLIAKYQTLPPQKSYSELYNEQYNNSGLPDLKTRIEGLISKMSDLDKEKGDKIEAINSNPWISEGLRLKKVGAVENQFSARKSALANNLQLYQHQYDSAVSEIRNATDHIISQANIDRAFNEKQLLDFYNLAQKQAILQSKTTNTDNKILSVSETKILGVPYGTTQKQAISMGITPKTIKTITSTGGLTKSQQNTYDAYKSEISSYSDKQSALSDLSANKFDIIKSIGQTGYNNLIKEINGHFSTSFKQIIPYSLEYLSGKSLVPSNPTPQQKTGVIDYISKWLFG